MSTHTSSTEYLEPRTLFAASLMPIATFTGANGDTPTTVIQDNSGDLIGITGSGGANGFGEIFRLPFANSPQLEILYSFTADGPEGRSPASLAMTPNGDIFGTTSAGGANNVGTLFKLARGSSTIEKILDLDDSPDTISDFITRNARLAPFTDPAGNLYGVVTPGRVFRVDAGSSTITSLDFLQGSVNDLVIDPAGNLFGTTYGGGAESLGSIFTIPAGGSTASTLASFTAAVGSLPNGVVLDSAGNLYGSTVNGGANGLGGVFRLAQGSPTIELLSSFDGTNGSKPAGKPALDDHGHLFGITREGGTNDSGTFYKLPAGSNTILPVVPLGPNETTIPVFVDANFGDVQQPIVADVNLSLDPDGWHFNYPPPPPQNPEPPDDDIPDDDEIRISLPAGGPSVVPGSPGGKGSITWASPTDNTTPNDGSYAVTVTGNVPASAVSGAPIKRVPVKVNVTNTGDQAINSTATVTLFASSNGQVEGATQVATTTSKLVLRADKSKAINLNITSFPDVPAGTYQLVARVEDAAGNTGTGAGPSVALAPAFVTASLSNFNPAKPTAVAGRKASFSLTLTNSGNIPAAGTVNITAASLTTDSSGVGGTPVTGIKPLKVKLKPGAERTFKINLTVPNDLPAGAYFLAITLDVAAIGDTNPANGVAVTLSPLTVS